MDGDGDTDVLSASENDDEIAWYENTDGAGSFGAQQVISNLADLARSVFAADVDGDGDTDVLSASENDDEIAWYENTDGAGSFGTQHVISNLADGAFSVFAADVDGDGDTDVLSASQTDDEIAWYEQANVADPLDPDSDDDGLLDGAEVNTHGTDPLDSDTDEDGLLDGFEVANSFDPLTPGEQIQDPDADGLSNLAEQAAGTDPNDADMDDDGLLDGFEVVNGFDPLTPGEQIQDPDVDGLSNLAEQAAGTDPNDADTDEDGLLDGFEVANGFDPLDPDEDSDGLVDGQDDFDADGLGNAAEAAAGTDPNDPDTDNDGLLDGEELGTGSFGAQHVISNLANGAYSVFAADVDGDGDTGRALRLPARRRDRLVREHGRPGDASARSR